ncbi:Succinyl-CoA ligase [ADP-forming] alpha chain [Bacillus sp. GeD10]|nr:Succinyl-CoA ligase [ADP-forming] alpha chain [Bacillus sp. GeD10]
MIRLKINNKTLSKMNLLKVSNKTLKVIVFMILRNQKKTVSILYKI